MCDRGRSINFENNHILTVIHMQHQHITAPTFQYYSNMKKNIRAVLVASVAALVLQNKNNVINSGQKLTTQSNPIHG